MRFLICGLGSIGRRHVQNLLHLGQNDLILYRTHKGLMPDEEFNMFKVETELEKALDHKPDAAIISNPTALHLNVAIPAVKNGCHVLIEKPISHSMQRIKDLVEVVEKTSRKVLVGFQFRFHPSLKYIKKVIEDDVIGKPLYAHAHWGEYLPVWHPWEDYRRGYSARNDLGGGVVLTLCHPIDYLVWLLGDVLSVQANVGKSSNLEIEVEDHAEAILHFDNGVVGSLHINYFQQPKQQILKIIGTKGTIDWDNEDGTVRVIHSGESDSMVFEPDSTFE